jgi:predicted enzyme related to lactoylglutathione lyase
MKTLNNLIQQSTVFFYYKNLGKATDFYEKILGLNIKTDLGWVKIFQLTNTSSIGLVDEAKGYLKSKKEKPVMITLNITDIKEWYNHLLQKGVKMEEHLKKHHQLDQRLFLIKDPEGYIIEFMEYV